MFVALQIQRFTMASTILKGRKFETTGSAQSQLFGQTVQSGEKGFGQGAAQEPNGHPDRAQEHLFEDGRILKRNSNLGSTLLNQAFE